MVGGVGEFNVSVGKGGSSGAEFVHLLVSDGIDLSDEGSVLADGFLFSLLVVKGSFLDGFVDLFELVDGSEELVGVELLGDFNEGFEGRSFLEEFLGLGDLSEGFSVTTLSVEEFEGGDDFVEGAERLLVSSLSNLESFVIVASGFLDDFFSFIETFDVVLEFGDERGEVVDVEAELGDLVDGVGEFV